MLMSIFSFSGCYTYLTLYDGAKLANEPYEPYYPPQPPPPCLSCGDEPPIIIIINPNPPEPKPIYERPREISDIRNGGAGRNPDNSGRRR